MGMFDDLVPAAPQATAQAAPQVAPQTAPPPSGGGGMFDDLVPQKPSIDTPEYTAFMAKKHGMSPDYVDAIRNSQSATSGVEGVPIVGGLAMRAAPYISAAAYPVTGAGAAGGSIADRAAKDKALEDEMRSDFKREHPGVDMASQLIGGTVATAPLAGTAIGARALGLVGDTLPAQIAAGAASGAGINALDAATRGNDITTAAGVGGLIGGAASPIARGIGMLASPLTSNIAARLNPSQYAGSQVARGIAESGLSADEVANRVINAAHEGQSEYTVADALGNPGQRLLSTVTRAPGQGRTDVANFLDQRQAGQGRRVSNILAEGFGTPETAEQTEARLTAERAAEGDQNYGAARQAAGSVNVTPVIDKIDETLAPGVTRIVNPQTGIADDSIEALMRRAKGMLTDGRSQVSRFDEAFRVKQEISNMIERAPSTAQRLLIPVRNALDDQLASASPLYQQARDRFSQQSKAIEAVGLGQTAAQRGRVENTVPQFLGLSNPERDAFRSGYVDPLIEQTQAAAVGANKARPLTSDAFRTEAQVMAPQQSGNQMIRQIGRENTMFETRNAALGGSKTADNLADSDAMAHAPTLAMHVLSGNVGGAVRTSLGFMANTLSGNTPAVRQEAARLLLLRGGNVTARDLSNVLSSATQQVQARAAYNKRMIGLTSRLGALQAEPQRANQ